MGETVDVRVHAEHLEVWYGSRRMERLPRLRGKGHHLIQYRHIIDSLVRKPGAFENYRYRADLFPTSRFRMAYDALRSQHSQRCADKEYLDILALAARRSETRVDRALEDLLSRDGLTGVEAVEFLLDQEQPCASALDVTVTPVDLTCYDILLREQEVAA